MKGYQDRSGAGGITGYKFLAKGIILQFRNKELYLYDYEQPGIEHVKQMKILAEKGEGLTTYVNQKVRENYKQKLS